MNETLAYYHVVAFATRIGAGNPAGVCPLPRWLDATAMQAIAAENNLSETAFFVKEGDGYALRWFTPTLEIDLCGHATLAAAFVIFERLDTNARAITFHSKSGPLVVTKQDNYMAMRFPRRPPEPCETPEALVRGLGRTPKEVRRARDYMAVFETEDEVRALAPDMAALASLDAVGTIATAPGKEADFVSRFFAPRAGVPEDPVTGSAHSTLIPFWAERLGKPRLRALQVSPRGGELLCEDLGNAVSMAGKAAMYVEGTIVIPFADLQAGR